MDGFPLSGVCYVTAQIHRSGLLVLVSDYPFKTNQYGPAVDNEVLVYNFLLPKGDTATASGDV